MDLNCHRSSSKMLSKTYSTTEWLVLAGIIGGSILAIVLLALLIRQCAKKCKKQQPEMTLNTSQSMERLVPPIFYTPDMTDPLYQVDLIDNDKRLAKKNGTAKERE